MKTDLVSIIVPCYNQAEFLDEALRSVQAQTYKHWECIIVNDGSQDDTGSKAEEWIKKDSRFSYLEQENKGLSEARNSGIKAANGTFILPLDADDKISSDYIDLAVKAIKNDNNIKVVYCNAEYFGGKTGLWNLPEYTYKTLLQSNKIFCSALFKKTDWSQVGGYDAQMKYGLEDWEFWINILKRGGEVKKLDQVGFYYRVKEASMIKSMTQEHIDYSNQYVWKKHHSAYIAAYNSLIEESSQKAAKLRSSKHAINLLTKKILGFRVFK